MGLSLTNIFSLFRYTICLGEQAYHELYKSQSLQSCSRKVMLYVVDIKDGVLQRGITCEYTTDSIFNGEWKIVYDNNNNIIIMSVFLERFSM